MGDGGNRKDYGPKGCVGKNGASFFGLILLIMLVKRKGARQ